MRIPGGPSGRQMRADVGWLHLLCRVTRPGSSRVHQRGETPLVCVRSSTINCCWDLTLNFLNTDDKWFLTVLGARNSESAIRGTRSPASSRCTISSSRGDSRLRSSDPCDGSVDAWPLMWGPPTDLWSQRRWRTWVQMSDDGSTIRRLGMRRKGLGRIVSGFTGMGCMCLRHHAEPTRPVVRGHRRVRAARPGPAQRTRTQPGSARRHRPAALDLRRPGRARPAQPDPPQHPQAGGGARGGSWRVGMRHPGTRLGCAAQL